MSNKPSKSRLPPSSSTSPTNGTSSGLPTPGSKLPKFLQKSNRDRSRSITDPAGSSTSIGSSSSGSSGPSSPLDIPNHNTREKGRRGSRLGEEVKPTQQVPVPVPQAPQYEGDTSIDSSYSMADDTMDEPPVIIEPVPRPTPSNPFPRPRTRSERPISDIGHGLPHSLYSTSSPSTSRIGDLPTRLSGWFSHTFSSSSTDLSLPSLLSQSSQMSSSSNNGGVSSPTKGRSSALLTAARQGTRHLDKAVRYLLDSDAQPDKSTDPIWILGVRHPGYEPPPPSAFQPPAQGKRRSSVSVDNDTGSGSTRRAPSSYSYRHPDEYTLSQSTPTNARTPQSLPNPATNWPPIFYADFTSRIWLTYRSSFSPIRDGTLATLEVGSIDESGNIMSPTKTAGKWNWVPGVGEKSWTSDSGWGCMLRTGQSLLANALVHMHLGRDWRRPPQPVHTADYALYVQIITWFLDNPSPLAPFSVHRMALAGKELGTDVGCWFGPSVAAGAIKTLVNAFPEAGLGVSVASDGSIYQSEIFAASTPLIGSPNSDRRRFKSKGEKRWGGRAVLVLVGIRLGLDGVNPIYYETIKALYTFPQSVGIAGGRPSSSYYFVGSQGDNLFYLDPHHARPAVPLRPPPKFETPPQQLRPRMDRTYTPENAPQQQTSRSPPPAVGRPRAPTSPSSTRTGGSTSSSNVPISPSPLQHQLSTSSQSTSSLPRTSESPGMSSSDLGYGSGRDQLDPVQEHFINAYSAVELKTFHCERVRKMPLSGLDPSMLIGFLVKDEADWRDFRQRVVDLGKNFKTIFTIQDEPPTWPSDSDEFMGLESISEPDDMDMDEPHDGADEPFFDTPDDRRSSTTSPETSDKGAKKSLDMDEEEDEDEDAEGLPTPGPASKTKFDSEKHQPPDDSDSDEEEEEEEDEEGWVDPSVPTPVVKTPSRVQAPAMAHTRSNDSSSSAGSGVMVDDMSRKSSSRSRSRTVPQLQTPQPTAHYPFPSSSDDTPQQMQREPSSDNWENNLQHRMHTARARDGGRTQSGGVKGVLTTSEGESV